MSFSIAEPVGLGNAHRHFLAHLIGMPGWHKAVLLIGALMAFGGGIGRVAGVTRQQPTTAPSALSQPENPEAKPVAAEREPDGSMLIRLSPHAMAVGLSSVAGFFLGWLFRAFVKTMILLALIIGGGLFALSYFGVLNVDLSSAKQEYASAVHWLSDQAARLKDVVLAHLPSSGGGAVGAWLGFHRR